VVMAGCTNGDRVDEVRVRHVRQVEAVLVSLVDLSDGDRVVLWAQSLKKFKFHKLFRESSQPYIFCCIFYIGTGPGSVPPRAPTTTGGN